MFLVLMVGGGLFAQVILFDDIFSSNMVLPAQKSFVISGNATPGVKALLVINNIEKEFVVTCNGRWQVELPAMPVNRKATKLIVKSIDASSVYAKLENILFGDLYIASGQSNMEFPVKAAANAFKVRRKEKEALVRLYHQKTAWQTDANPKEVSLVTKGESNPWSAAKWVDPNKVGGNRAVSNFSAVAWIAAKKIAQESGRPVGIIQIAVGGAPMEAFLPKSLVPSIQNVGDDPMAWFESSTYPWWCKGRIIINWAKAIPNANGLDSLFHYYAPEAIYPQIAKWRQLPVTGFFWYQGESNAPDSSWNEYSAGANLKQSQQLLENIVTHYKELWYGNLPFYIVQLPSMDRNWAQYRAMQEQVANQTEETLIVTIDTGDKTDVHPKDKSKIGDQFDIGIYSNPTVKGITFQDNEVHLHFDEAVEIIKSCLSNQFEVASESMFFTVATPRISSDGKTISLSSTSTSTKPLQNVRYAYKGYAMGNIQSKETKLPLAPFPTVPTHFIPVKIACVGDSITFGYHLPKEESYPNQLQELLGEKYDVANFGISGSCVNSKSMRGEQKRGYQFTKEHFEAIQFNADILISNLGINDIMDWEAFAKENFVVDYKQLVNDWKKENPNLEIYLWAPITPLFPGQKFYHDKGVAEINEAILEVAKETGVKTINMRSPLLDYEDYFPDKIHPSKEGYKLIAQEIANLVQ